MRAACGAAATMLFATILSMLVGAPPASAERKCESGVNLSEALRSCEDDDDDDDEIIPIDDHDYSLIPICGLGGRVLCHKQATCVDEDGNPGLYYRLLRDGEPTGRTVCVTEAEAEDAGVVTAGLALTAMRRLTWPKSELIIQPPDGKTLVNFETNFYTTNTDATTQTVTLLGQRVTIEASPTRYTWRFDDGPAVTTSSPGAPYPRLKVTHNYLQAATYEPAVDTVYAGRYRIGNGPWQTIPATLTVPGTTEQLRAIEAKPTLVG